MSSEWFRTFFSSMAVDFWLAVAPSPVEDIALLKRVFGHPDGGEILDLACGGGRHSIPLAQAGYRVLGVDLSEDMLAHARAAAGDGLPIEWRRGDMRELPWSGRFNGALCFGNSFGYFDRAATREMVAALSRALRPGAAFALESGIAAESLLPNLQPGRRMEVGDIVLQSSATYDVTESRLDVEYSFLRGGERETATAHSWVYTVGELRQLLSEHGFAVESLHSGPNGEPYHLGAPRLLLVARKAGP
jgi:SAM-dependent methyltransferase